MKEKKQKAALAITTRQFLSSVGVIAALMVVTFVLTKVIPAGEFTRVLDEAGNLIIDESAEFTYVEGGISFLKWLFSPILVLGASGSALLIAVIIFLLVIGGIFNCLEVCGLMKYLMMKMIHIFRGRRYQLISALILFFMLMGSFVGSFEEVIPLTPVAVGLAKGLGWDDLTGLFMCFMATGCGFAAGVCNPFTVGVAQTLSNLPMFSGFWLRAVGFVLIYFLLRWYTIRHARSVDRWSEEGGEAIIGADDNAAGDAAAGATGDGLSDAACDASAAYAEPETEDCSFSSASDHDFESALKHEKEPAAFTRIESLDRAAKSFAIIMGAGILLVLSSSFITALQDYTLIIMAITFLLAGIFACWQAQMKPGDFCRDFGKGAAGILPAVLMILMASSIKYTLEEAKVLDTILYGAMQIAGTMPQEAIVLFIYLIVLVMNFFVGSGSAKAFMLIPLIVPLGQIFGISAQLCILAFAFGDGFSNMLYPTNAGLLVSLSVTGVSYTRWFQNTWKFQALVLLVTSLLLLFGLAVGY